jgi:hypothetical protein
MDEYASVITRVGWDWFDMIGPDNPNYKIGQGREIVKPDYAGLHANIFELIGEKADYVHHHLAEEIYWVQDDSCPVELWLDGKIITMNPGAVAIITPGSWHATRPMEHKSLNSHILIVASPPFSEADQQFMDPQPEGWLST